MSSPPSVANSPPYPPRISLPQKRPNLSTAGPVNPKRRKGSIASSASHPLRQTSFPPGEIGSRNASYSPALDDRSMVSGTTATKRGRGRGRPRKDDASTTARSTARGKNAGKGSANDAGAGEEEEAEEEEGDGQVDTVLEGGKMDEAAEKQEKDHLRMLVDAFNGEQADRYDIWRRVKLKKETVRKITNQTLSQSVPQSIVTTVNGYTKIFIGELIERARDVQTQWLAASPTLPNEEPNPAYVGDGNMNASATTTVQDHDRGALTPDHLREALRRYKKDREGGGAGFQGLSLTGKEIVAIRTGGRRIFR